MPIEYVASARALVGTRFRAQGRGPHGLDCVGVVLAAYRLPLNSVRCDYALRGDHLKEARERLAAHFRRVPKAQLRPGDVMLLAPAAEQLHLAVRTEQGFIHAHARIRRVVETPGLPEWPMLGVYRKRRGR